MVSRLVYFSKNKALTINLKYVFNNYFNVDFVRATIGIRVDEVICHLFLFQIVQTQLTNKKFTLGREQCYVNLFEIIRNFVIVRLCNYIDN